MRRVARLVLLFIAFAFWPLGPGQALVNAQIPNTNIVDLTAAPNTWSNVIVHGEGDKWWGLGELNQKALEFLWKNGTLSKGVKVSSSVNINTRDPQTMCKFYYGGGFGRPLLEVQIGYDGEIRTFRSAMMREGGLGGSDPGAPKDGKLPKGARLVSPVDNSSDNKLVSQDGPVCLRFRKMEDRTGYSLEFQFTNTTSKDMEFSDAYFPWNPQNQNLILAPVEVDGRSYKPIRESLMVADWSEGRRSILLKPGRTMEGELPLFFRFPGMGEALKRSDVVLFWSYQIPPKISPGAERYSGMVVIPRESSPTK